MHKKEKGFRVFLSILSTLVIFFAPSGLVSAEASALTTTVTSTLGSVQFYPCAGEYIELHGDYMALFHVTFDASSGTHVIGENISKGIQGVGLQSGATFVASDTERRMTAIFGAPGFETTFVDTFKLIGKGQTSDLLVQITTHLTYAPDQGFTAQVSNVSSVCK
jgi:hypothetical protein